MATANTPERQGTTCLHLDVTDAINVMMWARTPSQVGARWHIFKRHDAPRLRHALSDLGLVPREIDPLHAQSQFLTPATLSLLQAHYSITPVVVDQHVGDLVLIPAGCPHQVRQSRLLNHSRSDPMFVTGLQHSKRYQSRCRLYFGEHTCSHCLSPWRIASQSNRFSQIRSLATVHHFAPHLGAYGVLSCTTYRHHCADYPAYCTAS